MTEPALGLGVLAAQIDPTLLTPAGVGGEGHRLDDREGVLFEQDPVLECPGLRLVGVANEMARLCDRLGDRQPLPARREGSAASSDELRGDDLLDHTVATELEGAGERPVAAARSVSVEAGRIDDAHSREQTQILGSRLRHAGSDRRQSVRADRMRFGRVAVHGAADEIGVGDRSDDLAAADLSSAHQPGRGRPFAEAETGALQPGRAAIIRCLPRGTQGCFELGAQPRRSAEATGEVVADVRDHRRPRLGRDQVVERRDTPGLGRRHAQAPADVLERTAADPPDAILHGVQGGQQQIAPRGRGQATARLTAVA